MNDPGPDAVQLKAMCAVTEHVTHGGTIANDRHEIEQASLDRHGFDGMHGKASRHHDERTQAGNQKCRPPPKPVGHELRNEK